MKLQLPNSVSSPQDLTQLTLEVREYARWFSHVVVKMRVVGSQVPRPPALSPAASEVIQAWDGEQKLNQNSLDQLVAALGQAAANAPTLTITLAAPAPGDLKQNLVGWCRRQIAPDALVTFKFNATLLGGMVVQYGSHVFDWSFRRQNLAGRDAFPEILRRV